MFTFVVDSIIITSYHYYCVMRGWCLHATGHMWRSDDIVMVLVLFYHLLHGSQEAKSDHQITTQTPSLAKPSHKATV